MPALTPTDCLIAVGANLGDRHAQIAGALGRLRQHAQISQFTASSLHKTLPVGGPPGQGPFLNGAARLRTTLPPQELLALLHQIEAALGRTRNIHWGPRLIDLDLLLYGSQTIDRPDLHVPHPRMHERRFVLAPAVEIAADMRHPVLQATVAELLARLDSSPGPV